MTQEVNQAFWQAIAQFNQGQFYACHDTLEALWMEAAAPLKTFYQGVLQIAVACYHLQNHNWRGAVILLGEGMSRLRDYQPTYAGIDVAQLVAQSAQLLAALHQAGPDKGADFTQRVEADAQRCRPNNAPGAQVTANPENWPIVIEIVACETFLT